MTARSSVAVLVLAAACAAKPDPRVDQMSKQIAALETKVAEQEHAIEQLRDSPELHAILERLETISQALAKVGGKGAAPARREPDRNAVYSVEIGASPVVGSPKAKVTLVMAGEFACPYCRKAWDTIEELRKQYGNDLRVVYKSFIVHPQVATYPAAAACAANRQGKFRALAELLWTKAFDTREFDKDHIDALAKEAGLDMTRYRADVDGACPSEVQAEQAAMTKVGVGATPSFFINGRYMAGAMPIEDFKQLIDEELAKATKSGVKPEKYYEQEVVAKGLKELAPAK